MEHLDFQTSMSHQGDTSLSTDDEMQTPSQARKSNKPLLEKKRRARINRSLEQLKGLVLEALKKDSARYSKLEKADILEMTVKHLREIQRHQMTVAMTMDPTVVGKYRAGFNECATEVSRYLSSIDGLSTEVRMRLMQHLANSLNQNQQRGPAPMQGPLPVYGMPGATSVTSLPGFGIRSGLPFGGLALSPESPTMPVSPTIPSPTHTFDYRQQPSSSREYSAVEAASTSAATTTSQYQSRDRVTCKRENTENIAPTSRLSRPLTEKNGNCYDGNNNNVGFSAVRPIKPERSDRKSPNASEGRMGNMNHNAMALRAAAMAAAVKLEPVWRPW